MDDSFHALNDIQKEDIRFARSQIRRLRGIYGEMANIAKEAEGKLATALHFKTFSDVQHEVRQTRDVLEHIGKLWEEEQEIGKSIRKNWPLQMFHV